MENGDLRAAVRALLPPRRPNCTSHICVFANGRDPPLPTALHVSTVRRRGSNPGLGCADRGQVAPKRSAAFLKALFTRMLVLGVWAVVATGVYYPQHL